MARKTIDALLAEARSRLVRLEPAQAWELAQNGAVLVDIRAEHERRVVADPRRGEVGHVDAAGPVRAETEVHHPRAAVGRPMQLDLLSHGPSERDPVTVGQWYGGRSGAAGQEEPQSEPP